MRRSKIWTTKFHAPLDFCLSFSLLLVYSIFVSCFAGHLLSFIYIFACFIFRNISFRNKCFLFCVRETMVSRGRMCKSLAATEFCKRCTYIPFVFLVLWLNPLSVGFSSHSTVYKVVKSSAGLFVSLRPPSSFINSCTVVKHFSHKPFLVCQIFFKRKKSGLFHEFSLPVNRRGWTAVLLYQPSWRTSGNHSPDSIAEALILFTAQF